jgi:hypothetical protein
VKWLLGTALSVQTMRRPLLWRFLEGNSKMFKCPEGIDQTLGSPTYGQPFQVSYGMNYVTGGPSGKRLIDIVNGNGSSNVITVWDHDARLCELARHGAARAVGAVY